MDVENTFVKMRSYINSDQSVYNISQSYKDRFIESLSLIKSHIDILNKEDKVDNYNPKVVEECINYLKNVVVENEIDTIFIQFIEDYIFVVHNWNENVWKNNILRNKVKYIRRVIRGEMNLKELLFITKELDKRLSKFKKWLPPAFEVSSHYFNLLKED